MFLVSDGDWVCDHGPRRSPHLSASGELRTARDRVCDRSASRSAAGSGGAGSAAIRARRPEAGFQMRTKLARDARGEGRLWRHADFVKLWAGQTISVVGSQVTVLALPTIAILLLHATAAQVGLLAALERARLPRPSPVCGRVDRPRPAPPADDRRRRAARCGLAFDSHGRRDWDADAASSSTQ